MNGTQLGYFKSKADGLTGQEREQALRDAAAYIGEHGTLEGWEVQKADDAVQQYLRATAKAKKDLIKNLRESGHVFHNMSEAELDTVVEKCLDSIHHKGSVNVRSVLREAQAEGNHPDEWLTAAARKRPGKRMQAALEKQRTHPVLAGVVQAQQGTRTEGRVMKEASQGTVASTMQHLRREYSLAERMKMAEDRISRLEQVTQRRADITDAGGSVRDAAIQMRQETGRGYKYIAKQLGANENTVKAWLRRVDV